MYVSRPVRAIRDDPVTGETVQLAVTVTDEDGERAVRDAVADTDGTVVAERQFGTLVVEVSEPAVATVCGCSGIETVETTAAIGIEPGDAGEDVDVDE
jgi:hypothetical protein